MNISATSPLVSVLLLLVSMSSIQASASLAKTIFPLVGPAGTTALRLLVASAILLVVMRPWKKAIPPQRLEDHRRFRPGHGKHEPLLLRGPEPYPAGGSPSVWNSPVL